MRFGNDFFYKVYDFKKNRCNFETRCRYYSETYENGKRYENFILDFEVGVSAMLEHLLRHLYVGGFIATIWDSRHPQGLEMLYADECFEYLKDKYVTDVNQIKIYEINTSTKAETWYSFDFNNKIVKIKEHHVYLDDLEEWY